MKKNSLCSSWGHSLNSFTPYHDVYIVIHASQIILLETIHTKIPITFPCWTMHPSLSHFWLRDNVFTIYNLHNTKMLSCYFKHFWSTVSWEEDSISQAPYFLCFSLSSPLHPLSFTSSSSYTSHFIKHLFNCHCF